MEYEWDIHGDVYGVLSSRNPGLMGFQQEVYRSMMGHIGNHTPELMGIFMGI